MSDYRVSDLIVEILLNVPEREREIVISEVYHNSYFCWHCGMGSKDHPNDDCYCLRDD